MFQDSSRSYLRQGLRLGEKKGKETDIGHELTFYRPFPLLSKYACPSRSRMAPLLNNYITHKGDTSLKDRYLTSPDVISRQIGDEFVLLDTVSNACHLLNSVAAYIWEYMETHSQQEDEGATLEFLVRQVSTQYDIPYETALADVNTFLADAMVNGIVICQIKS